MNRQGQAALGAVFVLGYTLVISSADAITKLIAAGYPAAQLFALSGLMVAAMSWGTAQLRGQGTKLRCQCPRAMALRSALTVVGSVAFFQAFRLLPFAEVFLFIGTVPILAGLFSNLLLGERVSLGAWAALVAGCLGMLCLFPQGLSSIGLGHGVAFVACATGALSLVLARYIAGFGTSDLAQVYYPNLALGLSMAVVLPFVCRPMPLSDLAWVAAYGGLLFVARWLCVAALRLLPAYTVTPLMNVQFIWMVALGAVVFGEMPGGHVFLGGAIVIGSGVFLVCDQMRPVRIRLPKLPTANRMSKTALRRDSEPVKPPFFALTRWD